MAWLQSLKLRPGSVGNQAREILNRVADRIPGVYVSSAKATWKSVAQKHLIEPKVTPAGTVNWIEFTLCFIAQYKLCRITRRQLFAQVLDELKDQRPR